MIKVLEQIEEAAKTPIREAIELEIKLSFSNSVDIECLLVKACTGLISMINSKPCTEFSHLFLSIKKSDMISNKLLELIKPAFTKVRQALRECGESYKEVSSVIRQNINLTNALLEYERVCNICKRVIITPEAIADFCLMMKRVFEMYKDVKKKVKSGSAEMFCAIPWLVVLNSFTKETKQPYNFHYPLELETDHDQWLYAGTKAKYNKICQKIEGFHHLLEAKLLDNPIPSEVLLDELAEENIKEIVGSIKELGTRLERCKPTDWNSFLQIVLGLETV